MTGRPSYHDLHVTTRDIPRTSIFNLPYGLEVVCNRVCGWVLTNVSDGLHDAELIAGEYEGLGKWLVLDVNGHVIVDSRKDHDMDEVIEGSGRPGTPRKLSDVIREALVQLIGCRDEDFDKDRE